MGRMEGLYIGRSTVVTDGLKGNNRAVVLDCVDETREPKRNPNLDAQYAVVKNWGIPILFRVVAQAQWYCDLIADIRDESAWDKALLLYTLDDMSALLQNPHRANGWVITAAIDPKRGTTHTWVAEVMKHIAAKEGDKWGIPFWFEFSIKQLAADASGQLTTLRDNQKGEWIAREEISSLRTTGTITLSDNLYQVLDFVPPVVVDPGEEEPEPETPVVDPPAAGTFEDQVLTHLASIDESLKQITGR
jgi:hypothetical protein